MSNRYVAWIKKISCLETIINKLINQEKYVTFKLFEAKMQL